MLRALLAALLASRNFLPPVGQTDVPLGHGGLSAGHAHLRDPRGAPEPSGHLPGPGLPPSSQTTGPAHTPLLPGFLTKRGPHPQFNVPTLTDTHQSCNYINFSIFKLQRNVSSL